MNDNTRIKAPQEAFAKTKDYFLGESLKPSENVPDLLTENRKIAVSLAENVMSLMDVIANYFGIPTMELTMAGTGCGTDISGPQRLCPVDRYL